METHGDPVVSTGEESKKILKGIFNDVNEPRRALQIVKLGCFWVRIQDVL